MEAAAMSKRRPKVKHARLSQKIEPGDENPFDWFIRTLFPFLDPSVVAALGGRPMSKKPKVKHALPDEQFPVSWLSIFTIEPSPENTLFYRPVTEDDPATIEMADSIRECGILEPLVVSADHYLLSGHRRHCAALMVGLKTLPCRVRSESRGDGEKASEEFIRLLLHYNKQRVKSRDEQLREQIASINPDDEYEAVVAYRKEKSRIKLKPIEIRETAARKVISEAKMPFLEAIQNIIRELEEFLPLSLRQIHYQLLNDPPFIHSRKPWSRYSNTPQSYAALIDLATRARHEGYIDYEAIHDPTRPVTVWDVHRDIHTYYGQQLDTILKGYQRDLLQSQANHIELIVEKNTLHSIVEPVAADFCLPLVIARGQCSTSPLFDVAERYKDSGKEKLVILAVSDLDPDGDAITHSLGQRLRDDYNIEHVELFNTALTMEQVTRLGLQANFEQAKVKSKNYQRYFETYDTDHVWELEALPPATLQNIIRQAVGKVIDWKAYNHEVTQQKSDLQHVAGMRKIITDTLQEQI
jgi:ParB-like nuclease domain